jgi:muramidase (phage lysozyme)
MSAEQQTFLQRLSAPESGGDYTSRNGTGHIADFSKHPGPGFGPDGTSSAAGRYQFTYETWNEAAAALGLTDFSPASQDRAAWWLANREYQQKTGRNLLADIQSGGHGGEIQTALKNRWVTITGATGAGAPAPVSASDYPSYARPGGGTGSYDSIISGALGRVRPGGTAGSLHSEVHIGSINVATAATDAHGIAGSIGDAVRRNLLVTQANRGLA